MSRVSEKMAALQEMLSGLSDVQKAELGKALEASDHLNEEDALVLSLLRREMVGKKKREHRDRVIQGFCDPFEDLLSDRDPDVKEPARISRKSIRPAWNWLREIGGEDHARICLRYEEALEFGPPEEAEKARAALWRAAVRLTEDMLDEAFADKQAGRALAEHLGGTRRLEDIREMLALVAIAPEIEALKAVITPAPALTLTRDQASLILEAYHRVAEQRPGHESWLIIAMMRRLLHEADILKVVRSLCRDGQDTLASLTDLAIVGDEILNDLDRYATEMEAACGTEGGAAEIVKLTREFSEAYLAVVESLDVKREGTWGQRMLETKRRVSAAIDNGLLKSARRDIFAALKSRKVQSGRTTVSKADLREDPDMDAYEYAEARALAIRDVARLGERIGVNAAIQAVTKGIVEEIHLYSDSLLSQITNVPDEYIARARSHVIMIARLMELLAGPDPAETFLKRAMRRIDEASS